jgi:hypothetical protein
MTGRGSHPALDAHAYPVDHLAEVAPGLAIADDTVSPTALRADGFDAIYDVYGRGLHPPPAGAAYVVHRIDDLPWAAVPDSVDGLANEIAGLVHAGRRVVITCSTGLDRSGLIVARALIALGHTPADAIDLVRGARGPRALSNRAFVRYLLLDCTPRRLAERGFGTPPEPEP